MKTITRNEKFGFPEVFAVILLLFLLMASYVFATPSPAMAQSNKVSSSLFQPRPLIWVRMITNRYTLIWIEACLWIEKKLKLNPDGSK